MAEKEIPLAGGNVNLGVVRVRNTVRRAMTVSSPTVHKFLEHLEEKKDSLVVRAFWESTKRGARYCHF